MKIRQRYLGPDGPEADLYWMRRAVGDAERALGATSPNPPVGAILVKDRQLLGQGHHTRAGAPHAEVEAFRSLEDPDKAAGSTLYVTLEPCSTQGRTPACTNAILKHRLKRVVFGSVDPNPEHAGRAITLLEEAGVEVTSGILQKESDALIRIFRHWILHRRPYIIAKAGLSLDGCLTRPPGESSWLTSKDARWDAQRLRVLVDAMVVGAETIRQDNPKLTVRHPWTPSHKRALKRFVLTRSGALPEDARIFTDAHADETRIIRDATWPHWLDQAADEGVTSMLVEGGGVTLTEALKAQSVQEIHLYLAPLVSGSGIR
ncbi:MAG: diaminohydroxyphosphoribosylaminopyrimidine deaminase, partial [Verrucomicrobiales bacterium]